VVNSGTIDVGGLDWIGALAITGNYTQTSTGVLNLEAAGSSDYDQLQVSGAATLAGTLNLGLIDSFVPVQGDTFVLLTVASSSGSFGTVNLPELDPEYFWEVLDDGPGGTITYMVGYNP
jgi:hypothetical protein